MSTTQPLLCARGSCLLLSDELMDIFVLLGFAVPSPLSSREKEKKEPNVYVCVCVCWCTWCWVLVSVHFLWARLSDFQVRMQFIGGFLQDESG